MKLPRLALVGPLFVAFTASIALSADLASLTVGSFTPLSEGQVTAEAALLTEEGRNPSLALSISDFEVGTTKDLSEANGSFSGQFELAQPTSMPISKMEIVIDGTIIKVAGASASIEVKIGGATKSINWADADEVAAPFSQTVSIDLPNGRLPSPFPVEATAFVKKSASGGDAIVSLKSIKVKLSEVTTASTN
jgi:hypothetical protein